MRKGKTQALVAGALIMAFAVVLGSAACGGGSAGKASSSPSAQTAQRIAEQILGHAPTGLAKTIEDRGTVVVADDADYPPQSYVNDQGKLVGFDVDVARRVGELLGLKVEFTNPEWETIPRGLDQRKFDVSIGSMAVTPLLEKTLDFTAPYYYTPAQVFVRKGGPDITGVKSLYGKTVGVGAATTYYDYLKKYPRISLKTYTTDTDALSALASGKVHYVLTAAPTGQQAIIDGQPIAFSGSPLYFEDLAFAVKKGEADWLTLLDYTVKKMHTDGSLTALSKKWYYGLDLTVKQ